MAASPSSSPRLPSPPPIAEDQLGQMSPLASPDAHGKPVANPFEAGASRRIRPGTKAADMDIGPPLVDISEIESPFQLTEHLKSLHNAALHRGNSNSITPIDRQTAQQLAQAPDGIDKNLWLYELCRLLCKEINSIIVALFQDNPPCSASTCTEMRASEWQYLCAVHDPPKPCCAIDYCCHTLDWTNSVLTSQKNFPSRMNFGDASGQQGANTQVRQLTNIFRRVYRIFAHAWFQHREMYWKVEQRSGLYIFFKTVCDVYHLIPDDNYTVPPEAEGIEALEGKQVEEEKPRPTIMKRSPEDPLKIQTLGTGNETRRHRHTPSGTESITTVLEEEEFDVGEGAGEPQDETIIMHAGEPATDIADFAAAPPGPELASEPADEDEDEAVDPAFASARHESGPLDKQDGHGVQAVKAPQESEAAGEKASASPATPPPLPSTPSTHLEKVGTNEKVGDKKDTIAHSSALSSETSRHVMADTSQPSSQTTPALLENDSPSTTTVCGETAITTASGVVDPSKPQLNSPDKIQKALSSQASQSSTMPAEATPAEAEDTERVEHGSTKAKPHHLLSTTKNSASASTMPLRTLTSASPSKIAEDPSAAPITPGKSTKMTTAMVTEGSPTGKMGLEAVGKKVPQEEKTGSKGEMEKSLSSPLVEREPGRSLKSSTNSSSSSEPERLSPPTALDGVEAVGTDDGPSAAGAAGVTGTGKAAEGKEAGESVGD